MLHLVPMHYGTVIPTPTPLMFYWFVLPNACNSLTHMSPTPFAPRSHMKLHMHYNEEMAFVYTDMHIFPMQERSWGGGWQFYMS